MKLLSIATILATGASLLASQPAMSQESEDTNPYGYDRSFITRPDHKKPTNPFAAKAEDFGKHSYTRMLIQSGLGTSAGLGIGNDFYNPEAYTYMNPDSFKANDATPEEVNRYIDKVYAPPTGAGTEIQSYQPNKGFDQPNPFKSTSDTDSSSREINPYGNTFDTGPDSPFMQKDTNNRPKNRRRVKTSDSDSNQFSEPTKVDTSESNF